MKRARWLGVWCVLSVALLGWASGCGDDAASSGGGGANNVGEDVGEDAAPPEDAAAPQEDAAAQEDAAPQEDAAAQEDASEADAEADVEEPDPIVACAGPEECGSTRACVEEVCVLDPSGLTYVESNFILEEPTSLTSVVSLLKGFLTGTGFLMTDFGPIEADGTMRVTYGGGERIERVEDGPSVYAWQFPVEQLPTFTVRPAAPEEAPDASNPTRTWVSERFDYRLMALFTFNGVQNVIGFEAQETVMTVTFSEDQQQIVAGRLEGYITRAEAESRLLNLDDPNCLLSRGICPGFECGVDAPLMSIADVLDCNGAVMNADVDPEIEGHDAYATSIFFESNRVVLE